MRSSAAPLPVLGPGGKGYRTCKKDGQDQDTHPHPAGEPQVSRSGKARVTAAVRLDTCSLP
jgi:hypothetical protein